MPRFHINSQQIQGDRATITGNEFIHITRVLRLGINDSIILFDDDQTEYECRILEINKKQIAVEIIESYKNSKESFLEINLFQSVPKGSKIDLIIQKTTELGVNTITPIKTQRGLVQETRKTERWEKIALEACKQCGRSNPPDIKSFIDYKNIIDYVLTDDLTLLFYENKKTNLKDELSELKRIYKRVNIIIGPEGGFTEMEIQHAERSGINIVGIGPRILRVETASIAAVTAIQYHFGDL